MLQATQLIGFGGFQPASSDLSSPATLTLQASQSTFAEDTDSITYQSGISSGDLLVLFLNTSFNQTWDSPSGWTKDLQVDSAGSTIAAHKIATGSESGSITPIGSTNNFLSCVMECYRPDFAITEVTPAGWACNRSGGDPAYVEVDASVGNVSFLALSAHMSTGPIDGGTSWVDAASSPVGSPTTTTYETNNGADVMHEYVTSSPFLYRADMVDEGADNATIAGYYEVRG